MKIPCVQYSDEFLNNIIKYCEKYTPNKYYPDKAIDVIDHCGAQAKVTYWDIKPSIKEMQTEIVDLRLSRKGSFSFDRKVKQKFGKVG